jgi:hypothetical protein
VTPRAFPARDSLLTARGLSADRLFTLRVGKKSVWKEGKRSGRNPVVISGIRLSDLTIFRKESNQIKNRQVCCKVYASTPGVPGN